MAQTSTYTGGTYGFPIYTKGGGFDESITPRLNDMARMVFDFFRKYLEKSFEGSTEILFNSFPFGKLVDEIRIFSQDRTTSPHTNGNAVDIAVLPLPLTPVFWLILHQYTNWNVFLSGHNKHIHIDKAFSGTRRNLKLLEYKKTRSSYTTERPQMSRLTSAPEWYDSFTREIPYTDTTNPLSPVIRFREVETRELLNRSINELYSLVSQDTIDINLSLINEFIESNFIKTVPENGKKKFESDGGRGPAWLTIAGAGIGAYVIYKFLKE